jgi:hypothetical protein
MSKVVILTLIGDVYLSDSEAPFVLAYRFDFLTTHPERRVAPKLSTQSTHRDLYL